MSAKLRNRLPALSSAGRIRPFIGIAPMMRPLMTIPASLGSVDDAIEDIRLGPDRVAAATMLFIRRGAADPSWGRLIVQALNEMGEFRDQISVGIRKDIRIGIEQGLFNVQDSEEAIDILLGVVASAIRVRIQSGGNDAVTAFAADSILRILGVGARRAEAIVKRLRTEEFLNR